MKHRVCPWWLGYWLLNPLRKVGQNPHDILAPYVREGMMVLEPGPGMGFFTLELARLVGPSGRVVVVDVQPKMIARVERRLAKAGLNARVDARIAAAESLGIGDLQGTVDFTAAYYMVHELPDAGRFFAEVSAASKLGSSLLVAEPKGHVKTAAFNSELEAASAAGFVLVDRPVIRRSHVALLKRTS